MAVDKLKLEVVLNAIDKLSRPMAAAKEQSKELATQIKQTQARIKELTETNAALQTRMARGEVPSRAMVNAMRDTDAQALKLNNTLRDQEARLNALNKANQRRGAIQASAQNIANMRDRMGRAGMGLGLAGATTLAATGTTLAAYAQAEDAATGLKVAMMDARGEVPKAYAEINRLATRLGDRLPGTTADYQNMMTMLIRQGMSAQSILGGLGEATATLAVQLKLPTEQAAEFAAKMQDATKTTERDMMGLMDVIQRTFYLGVDQNNMLEGMKGASLAMQIMRVEGLAGAKAMAPLLVMLDQAGMKGESAGNALRKVFQMGMNADKVAKGSKAAGVALNFTDGKGEFGGLENLLAQLKKIDSLPTQKKLSVISAIFGDDKETIEALSTMAAKGMAGYNEVLQKMAAQADLQKRVNEQLSTLKNLWDAASGTFVNMLATFGAALAPDVKVLVDWLGNLASGLREWSAAHPELSKWIMRTVAVVGLLLVGLGGLLITAAAVLAPFALMGTAMSGMSMAAGIASGALGMLRTVIVFVGRAMLLNPIGLAITAIAIAALLIYKYWEPIKAFFGSLWSEIKNAFAGGLSGIGALILNWSPLGLFYKAFQTVLGWFGVSLPSKFSEFGGQMLDGLVRGIAGGLSAVKTAIGNAGDSVVTWFKEKLGIHSPSRVFAQLGHYTMQGLDQGLQAGQRAPLATVLGMSRRLVAAGVLATLPPLAMATMPNASTDRVHHGAVPFVHGVLRNTNEAIAKVQRSDTPSARPVLAAGSAAAQRDAAPSEASGAVYHIHVHAAPGMDEAALTRLVIAKIEERERAHAAQSRARLSDRS